jgi:uncharacterized domain HDIG
MVVSGARFDAEAPVSEAIAYMRANRVGAVLVSEAGATVGIFTERDILMKYDFAAASSPKLRELMSRELVCASPDTPCGAALELMQSRSIRNLPVKQGADIVGMVSLRGLLAHYSSHLEKLLSESVDALTSAIGQRDPYTADHQRRVAAISVAIAEALGLPSDRLQNLRYAALAHDVGKIDVPIELLAKPGRLSKPEFELIKQHPVAGHEILKGVDFEGPIAEIVLQHHERIDGSGYPRALKGEAILTEARIIGVADVFEAIMTFRPYRPALGVDTARAEIASHRGSAFDPEVVDAFFALLDAPASKLLAAFN